MTQDFINSLYAAKAPTSLDVGEIAAIPQGFDFLNIAQEAKPTEFDPNLRVGLIQNNGVVAAREFLAPEAATRLDANKTYNYRFFPTKESIVSAQGTADIKRGLGGEFPYVNSDSDLKVASVENVGVSIVIERELARQEPSYRTRAFEKLVNIVEMATLMEAINALESIATAETWNPADGFLDDKLAEWIADEGDKAGFDPNRLMFGRRAWLTRRSSIGSANNAQNFNAPRTIGALADELGVFGFIPEARTASGASFPNVAANKIYAFIGDTGISGSDVSNLKMFSGKGGLKMTQWNHPQGELEILTVSRWQGISVTSPIGALAVTVSAQAQGGE